MPHSDKTARGRVFTVGLTGGIGSGKSAVAEQFRRLGVDVIDADRAARNVVTPDSPALEAIAAHFGHEVLQADGSLNRAHLRQVVFSDPQQRRWLENLLHPLIRRLVEEALDRADSPYAILESPLLLETDQHRLADRILVVDVPEALQIARAGQRDGNSEAQIRAIMDNQLERQARLARADDVVDNSGPVGNLAAAVAQLHQRYLKLAEEAQ